MITINKAFLAGRLAADPEAVYQDDRRYVVLLAITSTVHTLAATGKAFETEMPLSVDVDCGHLSPFCMQFLRRGTLVYLEGQYERMFIGRGAQARAINAVIVRSWTGRLSRIDGRLQTIPYPESGVPEPVGATDDGAGATPGGRNSFLTRTPAATASAALRERTQVALSRTCSPGIPGSRRPGFFSPAPFYRIIAVIDRTYSHVGVLAKLEGCPDLDAAALPLILMPVPLLGPEARVALACREAVMRWRSGVPLAPSHARLAGVEVHDVRVLRPFERRGFDEFGFSAHSSIRERYPGQVLAARELTRMAPGEFFAWAARPVSPE